MFCAVLCTTVVHNGTHTVVLEGECWFRFSILCVFFWFSLDYFVVALFAFVVLGLVSFLSTVPRDWLGRTFPKSPIFCSLGRKTLTQPVHSVCLGRLNSEVTCGLWIVTPAFSFTRIASVIFYCISVTSTSFSSITVLCEVLVYQACHRFVFNIFCFCSYSSAFFIACLPGVCGHLGKCVHVFFALFWIFLCCCICIIIASYLVALAVTSMCTMIKVYRTAVVFAICKQFLLLFTILNQQQVSSLI